MKKLFLLLAALPVFMLQSCDNDEKDDLTNITDRNTSATDERTFEIVLQSETERESIIGKQNVMLDGDWDDVIGLSTREVSFGKDGGTVEVATQGEFWWMTDITLNGEVYAVDYGETSHVKDWVSASKIGTTLQIEVSPNDTGAERTFSIGLEAGNYFDRVEGVQAAD